MKKILFVALLSCLMLGNRVAGADKEPESTVSELKKECAVIKGVVKDVLTGETLAGVAISVNGKTIYTNFEGEFEFANVGKEKTELKASLISYADMTLSVTPDDITEVLVQLKQL